MKSVKILHTSDWHLGKKLFKLSRLPEQKIFIEYFLKTIQSEDINLVIIAGDIFDTPQPPHEAISLFFSTLKRLSDLGVTTVIIAGNHDSAVFIDSPSPLLKELNVHVCGQLINTEHQLDLGKLTLDLEIHQSKIHLSLLPYFRNWEMEVLAQQEQLQLENEEDYLKLIELLFKKLTSSEADTNILVAHHLFGPFQISGSEQGISLGTLASIPLKMTSQYFNYAALGHIHKRQSFEVEKSSIVYCGSPLPFRFSESNEKSMELITIDKEGVRHEKHALPMIRKLVKLELQSDKWNKQWLSHLENFENACQLNPYYEVHLHLVKPEAGLHDIIRQAIHDSGAEVLSFFTLLPETENGSIDHLQVINQLQNTEKLFETFYQNKYPGTELPLDLKSELHLLLDEVRKNEIQDL